jgi:TolB-like protein
MWLPRSPRNPVADVFLSYAREDQAVADQVSAALEGAGYSVWWDRNLTGGARYLAAIEAQLRVAKAVLVVWSSASIASHWVTDEAEVGRDTGRLVPITPDGSLPPLGFRQFQVIDFTPWRGTPDETAFQHLLTALVGLTSRAAPLSGSDGSAAPSVTALAQPGIAIAVLPLVNMSSDPEQEYFSDGLAGRTSSFAFKGKTEDPRRIGERLGVAYVLEGSVRKAGAKLRISAQLVKCSDGFQLWSDRYDRELTDVFAVQDEIAHAVAAALRVTLGIGESTRLPGGTDDLQAYDKYLRARALYHQSGAAELLRAIELYRDALALDPQFGLAWYGLYTALAYTLVTFATDPSEARANMEQAAARIVALAPDAWWAHAMRADQCLMQHRWVEAEFATSAAVAAAPAGEVDALTARASFLMSVGRIDAAIATYREAKLADPLSLRVSGHLQLFLDLAGRRAEADAEFERGTQLAGDNRRWEWAALLRLWSGHDIDPGAVRARFDAFTTRYTPTGLDRGLRACLDEPDAARALLRRAFIHPATQNAPAMTGIFLYADHFRDKDLALAALRRSILESNKTNLEGLWWPFETGLRTDPRFKEIVRDIGLVDYWRTTGDWGEFVRPLGDSDFEVYR